jgi:hypothetical protein
MSSNQTNQNIYPKSCIYNCGIQIFWHTATSEYWEVFTKKKHICPNRVNNKPSQVTANTAATTTSTRPTYYKKPWNTQPKPKMSNSFELLTGPIDTIQKKYEVLSDIVIVEQGGKVHGSQSHIIANNNMQLIVYYEVPLGKRDEVKRKFDNMIRNLITLQQRN